MSLLNELTKFDVKVLSLGRRGRTARPSYLRQIKITRLVNLELYVI